jgi:hypothetical protein
MPVYPRDLKNWPFTLVCALTGVLIGCAVSSLSAFVLQAPGTRLARASFMVTVAVRSLVDLVVFLAAIAVGQFLVPNHPPARPVSISQRGHWALSGYAATNRPSGFARWPTRRLIHASQRYEKMGTYARRLRPGQIAPSQIICFRVPGGATLGPVHKCPQFHNLGIEALWFETAVLALPPAKALPQTG